MKNQKLWKNWAGCFQSVSHHITCKTGGAVLTFLMSCCCCACFCLRSEISLHRASFSLNKTKFATVTLNVVIHMSWYDPNLTKIVFKWTYTFILQQRWTCVCFPLWIRMATLRSIDRFFKCNVTYHPQLHNIQYVYYYGYKGKCYTEFAWLHFHPTVLLFSLHSVSGISERNNTLHTVTVGDWGYSMNCCKPLLSQKMYQQ